MRRRESEEYTERPIVKESRENMQEKGMQRSSLEAKSERSPGKSRPTNFSGGLSPEGQIIQKGKESYKSRYNGLLSSEKEIIQKGNYTYKNNRYK